MSVEEIGRLRNIALVGQGSAGKTQLAEAMLFTAGATTRLGRPDDGTSVLDFEPEELNHKASINSSFHHLNWKKNEIILGDTPGYGAFIVDSFNTLQAVDAGTREQGVVTGIDADGALLLETANGLRRIIAGDVTLEGAYQ